MENIKEQKNYLKEWYTKTAKQYDSWDTEGKLDAEFEGIKELLNVKKGEKEDSKVWSIAYWLRIFKKAVFFGWKVIFDK